MCGWASEEGGGGPGLCRMDAQFQNLPLSGAVNPQNEMIRTLLSTVIN